MCTVSFYLSFTLGKMARYVASGEQRKAEQVIRVLAINSRCAHCLPAKRGVRHAVSCNVLLLKLGVEVDFMTSPKRLAFSYQAAQIV